MSDNWELFMKTSTKKVKFDERGREYEWRRMYERHSGYLVLVQCGWLPKKGLEQNEILPEWAGYKKSTENQRRKCSEVEHRQYCGSPKGDNK